MIVVKSCQVFNMAKSWLDVCQSADSVSVSKDKHRYAIADGVTRSYFPEFFSRALTKAFTDGSSSADKFFDPPEITDTFNAVVREWSDKVHKAEQEADDYTKDVYEEWRQDHPYGASTFAGVTIEDDCIDVISLGDSCVFVIPDDTSRSPLMITSMPHSRCEQSCGCVFECVFGTTPHVINTAGYLSAKPVAMHESPSGACWLLMMTDALAEWFVNHYEWYDRSGALNSLLSLRDQKDFKHFVNSRRDTDDINNDDTSLIIVRLEPDSGCELTDY